MNRNEKMLYTSGRSIGLSVMTIALWPTLGWWSLLFAFGLILFAVTLSVETRSETLHEMAQILSKTESARR